MAEQARPQRGTTMQNQLLNMIRAKRNREKTILASMVANSPWNRWRWQLLWFYFRRWKNWVESGGNRKRWQLWCQSCFRVSKGGARALDRKWQIDLQVQCLCNKSLRKMLPHPPAFLHGAIFRTAYAESGQCYGYHVTAMYEKACSSSTCSIDKTLRIFWWFRFAPPFWGSYCMQL